MIAPRIDQPNGGGQRLDPKTGLVQPWYTHGALDVIARMSLADKRVLERALTLPRPLTLIVDNWQQDFVYVDERAVEMMRPHEGRFYVQLDHTNHEGRPWQTAIWELS